MKKVGEGFKKRTYQRVWEIRATEILQFASEGNREGARVRFFIVGPGIYI